MTPDLERLKAAYNAAYAAYAAALDARAAYDAAYNAAYAAYDAALDARAKPLAEVAPHTAEDPDERSAYDLYAAMADYADTWPKRKTSPWYLSILAAIKRGRELEQDA